MEAIFSRTKWKLRYFLLVFRGFLLYSWRMAYGVWRIEYIYIYRAYKVSSKENIVYFQSSITILYTKRRSNNYTGNERRKMRIQKTLENTTFIIIICSICSMSTYPVSHCTWKKGFILHRILLFNQNWMASKIER